MCATSALASCTLAVQGLIKVQWRKHASAVPVGMIFIVEAVTGERKSGNDDIALEEHRNFNIDQGRREKDNTLVYEREQKVWAAKEKGLLSAIRRNEKNGADNKKEEEALALLYEKKPSPPKQALMLLDDVTSQAIIRHLAEKYPYAGLFSNEAGILFASGALSNPGAINSLWDSGTGGADRITRGSIRVHDASLTVYLQVHPEGFSRFLAGRGKDTHSSGNSSRWIYAYPESAMGGRAGYYADPSEEDRDAYNARIRELLTQYDGPDRPKRRIVSLTEGAQQLLQWFSDAVEEELGKSGRFELMQGVAAKAAENCARLAAVMHEFEGNSSSGIGVQVTKGAIMLIAWHLNQYRMRFAPRSQREIDIAEVEECITRHAYKWKADRRVSSTDLCPLVPLRLRKVKDLRPVMELLEADGKVTIRDNLRGGGWVVELDYWFPITDVNGRPRAHPTAFPHGDWRLHAVTQGQQEPLAAPEPEPPVPGYALWPGVFLPSID